MPPPLPPQLITTILSHLLPPCPPLPPSLIAKPLLDRLTFLPPDMDDLDDRDGWFSPYHRQGSHPPPQRQQQDRHHHQSMRSTQSGQFSQQPTDFGSNPISERLERLERDYTLRSVVYTFDGESFLAKIDISPGSSSSGGGGGGPNDDDEAVSGGVEVLFSYEQGGKGRGWVYHATKLSIPSSSSSSSSAASWTADFKSIRIPVDPTTAGQNPQSSTDRSHHTRPINDPNLPSEPSASDLRNVFGASTDHGGPVIDGSAHGRNVDSTEQNVVDLSAPEGYWAGFTPPPAPDLSLPNEHEDTDAGEDAYWAMYGGSAVGTPGGAGMILERGSDMCHTSVHEPRGQGYFGAYGQSRPVSGGISGGGEVALDKEYNEKKIDDDSRMDGKNGPGENERNAMGALETLTTLISSLSPHQPPTDTNTDQVSPHKTPTNITHPTTLTTSVCRAENSTIPSRDMLDLRDKLSSQISAILQSLWSEYIRLSSSSNTGPETYGADEAIEVKAMEWLRIGKAVVDNPNTPRSAKGGSGLGRGASTSGSGEDKVELLVIRSKMEVLKQMYDSIHPPRPDGNASGGDGGDGDEDGFWRCIERTIRMIHVDGENDGVEQETYWE